MLTNFLLEVVALVPALVHVCVGSMCGSSAVALQEAMCGRCKASNSCSRRVGPFGLWGISQVGCNITSAGLTTERCRVCAYNRQAYWGVGVWLAGHDP
jgi:hypothetical protein